jgi:hypothetical protein
MVVARKLEVAVRAYAVGTVEFVPTASVMTKPHDLGVRAGSRWLDETTTHERSR